MWVLGSLPILHPRMSGSKLFVSQMLRWEALPTPHLVSASVLWPHFIPRRIFCVFAARQCCPVDHAHVGCISAWSWSLSCQEPALDVILDSKAPRHSQNTTCVSKTVRIHHWLQNFQYFPPATACPESSVLKAPHVS